MDQENDKIVVIGLIVNDGQILIVKRTKQEDGKEGAVLSWGFPGGKVEAGETMEQAVIREVHEETGSQVSVEKLISKRVHPDFPVRAFYFSCHLISDIPDAVNDLSTQEVRWVKPSDLATYFASDLDPIVSEFLFDKA